MEEPMYNREYYQKNKFKISKKRGSAGSEERRKRQIAVIRCRAREKGYEFNLTYENLEWPQYCPLLGIELNYLSSTNGPNSPSVDRKDSTKGYTADNCWVISKKANTIKNDATIEELELLTSNLKKFLQKDI